MVEKLGRGGGEGRGGRGGGIGYWVSFARDTGQVGSLFGLLMLVVAR